MLSTFWTQFLVEIEDIKDQNPIVYSLIKQLTPLELTEKKLLLSCENQGLALFLKKKLPDLEKRLFRFASKKIAIEIVVKARKRQASAPLLQFEPTIDDVFKKAGLYEKFAFENFAVSSSNQVAFAASQAVIQNLGKAYNPLFFYGGVGVGKTHLAQAIARKTLEENPSYRVLYCPGDQFTNELIESIRERQTPKFRRKYRRLNLLIVDDVQFIGGKNTVQEEFFHTFNAIISSGGQVVLTADRPPHEIKNLEDRLRSRFSGGLIVDIQSPDFELRCAILLIKAREKKISIEIEVAKIVAEQVADTRALEGTLLSLYAKTLGRKEKIDLEEVESFFKTQEKNGQGRLDPNTVIKAVCSYFDIKQSYLKSPARSEHVALPRQIAMFLLREKLGLKFDDIARLLKKKDHTTVIHGVGKVSRMLVKDSVFKQEVDQLVQGLYSST